MYKNILFDLDGTLTDSKEGIVNSFIYALKQYDIEVKDREDLNVCIGPPLQDSFENVFGFSTPKARDAIAKYREYYSDKGMLENAVYPNICEMLETLKKGGKRLFVATSKPEKFTYLILEHFDLLKYFEFVSGASNDDRFCKKGDIIRRVIETYNLNLEETIMVGDRLHDMVGAKENGIAAMGVLYGYGTIEEFEDNGAKYVAKDALEIVDILL